MRKLIPGVPRLDPRGFRFGMPNRQVKSMKADRGFRHYGVRNPRSIRWQIHSWGRWRVSSSVTGQSAGRPTAIAPRCLGWSTTNATFSTHPRNLDAVAFQYETHPSRKFSFSKQPHSGAYLWKLSLTLQSTTATIWASGRLFYPNGMSMTNYIRHWLRSTFP